MDLLMGSKQFEQNFSNVHVALASRDGCDPHAALAASCEVARKMHSSGESRGGGSPRQCGASPAGTCRPPALFAAPAPLPLTFTSRLCLQLNRGVPLALKLLITKGTWPLHGSGLLFLLGKMEVY